MKSKILLLLFLLISFSTYSQHTFKYQKYCSNDLLWALAVAEDARGNIVAVYEKGGVNDIRQCYLQVLNPEGGEIKNLKIDIATYYNHTVIEELNDTLYIISCNFTSITESMVVIYKITEHYTVEKMCSLYFNNRSFYRPRFLSRNDGRIILATGLYNIDSNFTFNELFFVEFNQHWDTLQTIHYPELSIDEMGYDAVTSTYYMFGLDNNRGRLFYFDYDLNIINSYYYNGGPFITSGIRVVGSNFILLGSSSAGKNIELCLTDSIGKVLNVFQLGNPNIRQQMAYNKAVVNSTNGQFYGYSCQWDGMAPFSETPLNLHLVKFDSSMQVIFEKYYCDNASYVAMDFVAAKDGGCIMYANIYDTAISKNYFGIQILKVDSLGNFTQVGINQNKKQELSLLLYPNPGNTNVHINFPEPYMQGQLNFYNTAGTKVFSQIISAETNSISISNLSQGIYLYELISQNKVLGRGKWIKE